MDSISQFVLGAGVALAISPVKSRRIALIGGALATVPDLDILVQYDNELTEFVSHRSFSHSLFVLALLSLPLASGLKKWQTNLALSYQQWLWVCLGALLTHPLLDSLTIFGTQLFWPLPVKSVMIGSMFIADPLYTVPLLLSLIILLIKKRMPVVLGYSLNTLTLGFSTFYLVLSLVLQSFVLTTQSYPDAINDTHTRFAMPTPINLIIWRTTVKGDAYFYESFYHLFKGSSGWKKIPHNQNNYSLKNNIGIDKYRYFSHGFYRLSVKDKQLLMSDVRMGTIALPIFSFVVAKKVAGQWQNIPPRLYDYGYFGFEKMFGGQTIF